jgi:hypothetical protein
MTKLEELKVAAEAANDAAVEADEAEHAAWADAWDAVDAANDAWANSRIAFVAYQAELDKQENSDD